MTAYRHIARVVIEEVIPLYDVANTALSKFRIRMTHVITDRPKWIIKPTVNHRAIE